MRDAEARFAGSTQGMVAPSFRTGLTGIGVLALLVAVLFVLVSPARAAEHPFVTGEYGKTGPAASGIGAGCQLAYQSQTQRLYLFSDDKIYGLERGGPGSVSSVGGAFPIGAVRSDCGDPDFEVDNSATGSSGNLYAIPSKPATISAWDSAGSPLGSPWPLALDLGEGEACGLAVTKDGEVWAGYYSKEEIIKFSSSGASLGSIPLGYTICKLAVDPTNSDLYAVHYSAGQVTKYTAASGYTTAMDFPVGGSGNAGVAINGALNRLYLVNGGEINVYDTNSAVLVETISLGGNGGGLAIDEGTDTVFATVGAGATGVIKEWAGIRVPKATTGEPIGNDEVAGTTNPNAAGDITECYFEFGLTIAYGSKQNCTESLPITTEQEVHAKLPGLFGEQTYHYRLVLGTDAPGIVGRGSDKTIVPHYVPDLKLEAATEVQRTTAKLNASFDGNGEDTSYYFEWGPTTAYGDQTPALNSGAVSGHTPLSGMATGLAAEHVYHFRVVATNGQGTSKSPDLTFTTALAVKDLGTTAATDTEPTTATLNGTLDPDGLATTFYFQYGKSTQYGQVVPLPPGKDVGTTAAGDIPVSVGVEELEPGTVYHYRIVAVNETGSTTATNDVTFETPSPPSINAFNSSNITSTTARLQATINPNGEETSYYFEYGTTPGYGAKEPVTPGVLPPSKAGEVVAVELTGLESKTYHFRIVAKNKWGTTASSDQTFSFYPPECPNAHFRQQTGSGYLPDCRAYELVSPEDAGGTILFPGGMNSNVATSPSRFAFGGQLGAIEGTGDPQGERGDIYIATRTNLGWVSRYVGIRGNEGILTGGPPNVPGGPDGVFTNLSMDKLLDWDNGQQGFTCCGMLGSYAPYMWDSHGDPLGRLPTNLGEIPNGKADATKGGFIGAALPSPDFSHYFFSSNNVAFADEALTTGPGSAYDNNLETGEITVISKTAHGNDIPRDAGSPSEFIKFPGVSTDGSHILMSTKAAGGGAHLYLAVDAQEFFDVSVGTDGVNRGAEFEAMTADGETVYFTSSTQLTVDDTDTSRDLYMWTQNPTPAVTRISQGTSETGNLSSCGDLWATGCNVEVVEIIGEDEIGNKEVTPTDNTVAARSGDVFFYSSELLDNGKGTFGERNFYVYRGGRAQYIATFTAGNKVDRIQVAPDGLQMAFLTKQRLTAYDNAGHREMYSYEPAARKLVCVSCIPDGTPPTVDVEASENGLFMADDGRTFFSTADGLVDRDANGLWDVYEFVESRPQLITSGTSNDDQGSFGIPHIGLSGVSADGTDVYFSTLDILVAQDRNGSFYKFYDARTNGGIEFTRPVTPCAAADECHGPSSTAPAAPTMGTSAHLGSGGNAKSTKPRKRKKQRKKSKRQVHRGHGNRG